MSSRLRLLFPRIAAPRPRAVVRDTTQVLLDDGEAITVLRVRDPRARRLRLSVDERGARLTLPPRASLVAGQRFLDEHRDWLAAQVRAHAVEDCAPLVAGGTAMLPLRGADLPVTWREARYARVLPAKADCDGDALVFQAPAGAAPVTLRRALRDFYEAQALADAARWIARELPGLPRAPTRLRFRQMSSQWGSLAPDGAMSLDLSLVLGAPQAFDYVVVHELCHLLHADHSDAFWREVEARSPDWRVQRAYFHAEGRRLKARLRALLSGDAVPLR